MTTKQTSSLWRFIATKPGAGPAQRYLIVTDPQVPRSNQERIGSAGGYARAVEIISTRNACALAGLAPKALADDPEALRDVLAAAAELLLWGGEVDQRIRQYFGESGDHQDQWRRISAQARAARERLGMTP